jgi:pimeloyl-ACP methyl ester carboxylesterase
MKCSLNRIAALAFLLCFASAGSARVAAWNGAKVTQPCAKAQEHFVTVEGVRVHYIEAGSGPTLVMIHGNAGGVEDFALGAIELLCSNYRIIAVDRAGHGKSERPSGKTPTVEYQADLLHQTLAHLGITEPVLVGHSWGASLALAYALKYEREVSGLVLLAPAAYPDKGANKILRVAITPPLIGDAELMIGKLLFGRHVLTHELARAFYPEPVPKDYLKMAASSWLTRQHLKSYLEDEWSLNASLKKLSKRYSEIHVPVVIVTGDKDKVVSPRENAHRLKAAISQAQLIEIRGGGHEIPQTHPETLNQAMRLVSTSAADNRR